MDQITCKYLTQCRLSELRTFYQSWLCKHQFCNGWWLLTSGLWKLWFKRNISHKVHLLECQVKAQQHKRFWSSSWGYVLNAKQQKTPFTPEVGTACSEWSWLASKLEEREKKTGDKEKLQHWISATQSPAGLGALLTKVRLSCSKGEAESEHGAAATTVLIHSRRKHPWRLRRLVTFTVTEYNWITETECGQKFSLLRFWFWAVKRIWISNMENHPAEHLGEASVASSH